MKRSLLALALLLAGCPRPGVKAGGRAAPVVRVYEPFAMARDLEDPGQAVWLGTGPGGAATVMAIRTEGWGRVEVAGDRGVRVMELSIGAEVATGPAGMVLAVLAAARGLGKDGMGYGWGGTSSESAGAGEGLAGAGAVAVGYLASLTGATIDPAVGVIGSVLPDGSLASGPGAPEQLAALLAAGKRRIGVPAGVVQAESMRTGRLVDLAASARSAGAVVVSVADVGEAYRLLTGEALPVVVPLSDEELALPAATTEALARTYGESLQLLAEDWAALLLLDNAARLPTKLAQLAAAAQQEAKLAEQLREAGAWSAALDCLGEARALGGAAVTGVRIVEAIQRGQVDEAIERLQGAGDPSEAMIAELAAMSGGQLQQLAGLRAVIVALAHRQALAPRLAAAATELATFRASELSVLGSEPTARRVATLVAPVLVELGQAQAMIQAARWQVALSDSSGRVLSVAELQRLRLPRVEVLAGLAAALAGPTGTSATAGSATGPSATAGSATAGSATAGSATGASATGTSATGASATASSATPELWALQLARSWLATPADGASGLAVVPGAERLAGVRAQWGPGSSSWYLASWASSGIALQLVAQAVAERETLRSRHAADGSTVVAPETASALPALLRTADRHARSAAHAAKVATGQVPLALRLAYQAGHQLAGQSTPALQLRALQALWWATAIGEAAIELTRATAEPAVRPAGSPAR